MKAFKLQPFLEYARVGKWYIQNFSLESFWESYLLESKTKEQK
ncbi:hypothetical protein [Helicobacter canadensis]|nr:hypothetical protein [Helicobacter canadensis]EFR49029.1 hypothetical protein HCMG_01202 [Helicobacter canadensis MIT 98-5491]